MPHNLYLHSALVQSRNVGRDDNSIRTAIQFNTVDASVALTIAFFVNAAILVLAALVFYGKTSVTVAGGQVVTFSPDSDWIRIAYLTLAPLLGTVAASTLFAVALLASGQSSTITGTLAGQVVMEGFMNWRMRPWLRRMISRLLAVIPAIIIVGIRGNGSITDLVNLSQVISLPYPAVRHVSVAAIHLLAQNHGPVAQRLVPAGSGLGQRAGDYRNGYLQPAGRAQRCLARHHRQMRQANEPESDV